MLIVENEGVLRPSRALKRLNPALREFHRFVLRVRGRFADLMRTRQGGAYCRFLSLTFSFRSSKRLARQ